MMAIPMLYFSLKMISKKPNPGSMTAGIYFILFATQLYFHKVYVWLANLLWKDPLSSDNRAELTSFDLAVSFSAIVSSALLNILLCSYLAKIKQSL